VYDLGRPSSRSCRVGDCGYARRIAYGCDKLRRKPTLHSWWGKEAMLTNYGQEKPGVPEQRHS